MMDKTNKLALLKELAVGLGDAPAAPEGAPTCPTCGQVTPAEPTDTEELVAPPGL
jgi:hypothetical protein